MAEKTDKRPILVPVDFSPYSEAALLQACELEACMKRGIIVLHVVHDPAEMPGYYSQMTKKKRLARIEEAASEMFEGFLKNIVKRHPDLKILKKIESRLVLGLPANRILEVAEKTNASVLVMGSKGRTGLKHILLGSVAQNVAQLCPIPVMIVKTQQ